MNLPEDAKSTVSRGRNRTFYVANPSSDSDGDDRYKQQYGSYPSSPPQPFTSQAPPLLSPSSHLPYTTKLPPAQFAPAPLTTNFSPDHTHQYHSSRSNPALSSPSSTSSPAAESTPPPSTPGMSIPPVDLTGDGPVFREPSQTPNGERNEGPQLPSSRPPQTVSSIAQTRVPQVRPTLNTRHNPSPTVSTPDSFSSTTIQGSSGTALNKLLIVVTSDSDRYLTVDITGARDPAFIKERIFTKLCIWDEEDQSQFSIYRTEIGEYAIGEALTDDRLFELCRENGDSKGSLKFFVSHSSAPVHESLSQSASAVSPTVNTIPPPVLPYTSGSQGPLRPKRRSRHGSLSSTSERMPPEATGYEASVSDDLDVATQQRPSLHRPGRPSVQNLANQTNFPPSPRGGRRPTGPPRARSPLLNPHKPTSPPLPRPPGESPPTEKFGYSGTVPPAMPPPTVPPPPPPLSPNRAYFGPENATHVSPLIRAQHVRSGSDTVAERERALAISGSPAEQTSKLWRQRQVEEKASVDRMREQQPVKEARLRDKRQALLPDDDKLSRVDSWVVVDRDEPPPPQNYPPRGPSRHRQNQSSSPQRYKTPNGRTLEIPKAPRQPPPTPPIAAPSPGSRNAGPQNPRQLVPPNWAVAWKSTGKEEPRGVPTTNVRLATLTKSMDKSKSMDNLRGALSNHPSTLQPGVRRPSQLPVNTKPCNSSSSREGINIPTPNGSYIPSDIGRNYDMPGLPKSYDPQRGLLSSGYSPRPLPVQGSTSNLDFSSSPQALTINRAQLPSSGSGSGSPNDPYPRPSSALDDAQNSPNQKYTRQLHSPTYTGLESPYEQNKSPRAGSPNRQPGAYGSRLNINSPYGDLSEAYGGIDIRRTPPRSPHSPKAAAKDRFAHKPSGLDGTLHRVDSQSSTDDTQVSESSTIRPGEADWLRQVMDQFSDGNFDGSTVMPSAATVNANPPPKRPEVSIQQATSAWVNDPSPSTPHSGQSSVVEEDSESDNEGTMIWKKRPVFDQQVNKSVRPPLKVQISGPSRNNSGQTAGQSNQQFHPGQVVNAPAPLRPAPREPPTGRKGPRGSTFSERGSTWAPRPPAEDVYERLEEFFPMHDLDKPVIEASSGGTSPTAQDFPVAVPTSNDKARVKGKKSIRIVAEEHKKRIDRNSRAESTTSMNMARKRSTKLWGSRLEEVTPGQARVAIPPTLPESPNGGPKPIFKWVRGELIGRGTYGRVYLALNATTGEMIAVKQVEMPRTASDKNDSRQVTMVQALKLESETLKDLDHPNIVQYLGFEETRNFLSIFLEYVPGGSVGSCLLKHGKFDEEVTKSFTGQILGGLEYLHSKNILHRDLKADNILVETTGICKISDFGISKRTDDISGGAHTAMQGTVFWMAPEVINTKPGGYNFKIDIWSVGCVVLEMWAGSRPWLGDEAVAVMFKLYQAKQPPPVPDGVTLSQLADDFRRKCFAINPDERPSASELRKHPYLTLAPGWTFTDFK